MGFSIARGLFETKWLPVINTDTLYHGQLVVAANEGVQPLSAATGAADTTAKQVIGGIVVGDNLSTPLFNTTYNSQYITYVSPNASTTEYNGVRGWPTGAALHEAMVEVAIITPETIIKAPIFNGAVGTATTVGTVTTGGTVSSTVNALEVAGVATFATAYFRKGVNAGAYRITDDSSTTAITWDTATYGTVAVGDTLVRVNGLRTFGQSRMQVGTEALYVDSAAALTTDYFSINVVNLNLEIAGQEYVEFTFNPCHFDSLRA